MTFINLEVFRQMIKTKSFMLFQKIHTVVLKMTLIFLSNNPHSSVELEKGMLHHCDIKVRIKSDLGQDIKYDYFKTKYIDSF